MKAYRSFVFLIFFLSPSIVLAQKGSITGSVTDSTTADPVSFASIALLKTGETSAITGGISNADGRFTIPNIPTGNYQVMISFLGFETRTISDITISGKNPTVDLGQVTLKPSSLSIAEVEVTGVANTAVSKIDRTTYRATDFETARGGNALDVLSKLPSVSVNPDGRVSVRGATDFMVYLNGKPTLLNPSDILSQIPSNQMESVDIITVPSSRYDAQGKGGIINITTKRSQFDGLSVSVNGMGGGTPWRNSVDHFSGHKLNNDRYNTGASLVYNQGRLSVNGSFNINAKNNKGIGDIGANIYQDPHLGSTSAYPNHYFLLGGLGNRPKWANGMMATAGLSYALSERSEISAVYQYAQRESGRAAHYLYQTGFSEVFDGPISFPDLTLYNPNHINRTGTFSNLSLDYSVKLDDNSQIQSSLLYERSGLDQTITNKEYFYDPIFEQADYDVAAPGFHSFQTDETPLEAWRFELNYQKDFDHGSSLSAGFVPQWVKLSGIYRYDTIRSDGSAGGFDHFDNSIDLQRDVYAAYIDYSGNWKKLSYMLGLRMEYLNQKMNVSSTAYFRQVFDFFGTGRNYDETQFLQQKLDLFPSVHLRYQANDKNTITFASSRRINRPPAKAMSPFLYRRHQEIFELGDPLLSPEYIFNAELSYRRSLGSSNVVLTGFYRGVNDAIYRVNRLSYDYNANPGGVLLRSYTNSGDQVAIGGELGVNIDLLKKIELFLGGSVYNFQVEADERLFGEQLSSSSVNWSFKSNINWTIIQSLKFTFDYIFESPTVTPQGENVSNVLANIALNYQPEKQKNWNFSARLLDVLGTNQSGGYTTAYTNGIRMFNRAYIYDYEGQIIEFSASYTINMKGKKAAKKDLIGGEYF